MCVLDGSLRFFFFFKQKTAYEMRISDWSSDVCSSDLPRRRRDRYRPIAGAVDIDVHEAAEGAHRRLALPEDPDLVGDRGGADAGHPDPRIHRVGEGDRTAVRTDGHQHQPDRLAGPDVQATAPVTDTLRASCRGKGGEQLKN